MKVYVLLTNYAYEGAEVESVHDTLEGAMDASGPPVEWRRTIDYQNNMKWIGGDTRPDTWSSILEMVVSSNNGNQDLHHPNL
jgi:hypothetical protein